MQNSDYDEYNNIYQKIEDSEHIILYEKDNIKELYIKMSPVVYEILCKKNNLSKFEESLKEFYNEKRFLTQKQIQGFNNTWN